MEDAETVRPNLLMADRIRLLPIVTRRPTALVHIGTRRLVTPWRGLRLVEGLNEEDTPCIAVARTGSAMLGAARPLSRLLQPALLALRRLVPRPIEVARASCLPAAPREAAGDTALAVAAEALAPLITPRPQWPLRGLLTAATRLLLIREMIVIER